MSLASLVQQLVELPESLLSDYVAARESEECPPESLIVLIAAFRDAVQDLGGIRKRIEQDLREEHAPKRTTFQVPELGAVEVGAAQVRTKWDKEQLLPRILSRIVDKPGVLADKETGETHPPAVIAENVYRWLRDCITFGNPKLPGLRALGFDPDDYSESRWEPVVSLPKRAI